MSQAATLDTHTHEAHADVHLDPAESPLTPESWGKLGMWIFLAADAMTFGAAIAAYAALRMDNVNWPDPAQFLGITFTAIMTFILIVSSLTMVEALLVDQARQYVEVPVVPGPDGLGRARVPRDAGQRVARADLGQGTID